MARGRGRRGRRLGNISGKLDGPSNESLENESRQEFKSSNNELELENPSTNNDTLAPKELEEIEEEETAESAPPKRLTEGEIDIDDAESETSDAEDDALAVDDDLTAGSAQIIPAAEKAAEKCRLPPRTVSSEELALFPFLESASRSLRESFLIARNSACLMWIEDPSTQVTSDRLVGYLVTSLSQDSIRIMYEAGLTSSLPTLSNTPSTASLSTVAAAAAGSSSSSKSNGEPVVESKPTRGFSPPSNWSPWSSSNAKVNVERLAYLVVLFLERFGYINYGVFKILSPPLTRVQGNQVPGNCSSLTNSSPDRSPKKCAPLISVGRRGGLSSPPSVSPEKTTRPLKVIVCGAGAAGLIAARQLTYFGARVTILESQDRIGGRIWTLKRGENIADLGAMIVTGMSANPVAILAKQAGLTLQPVNMDCILYASSGRLVSREKDSKMEEEFNRLLSTATYLCHNKGLDTNTKDGSTLSLGGVLDDLIRYQDNHIAPLKTTHRKLYSVLLERKTKTLAQMAAARNTIEISFKQWQRAVETAREAHEQRTAAALAASKSTSVETFDTKLKPSIELNPSAPVTRRSEKRSVTSVSQDSSFETVPGEDASLLGKPGKRRKVAAETKENVSPIKRSSVAQNDGGQGAITTPEEKKKQLKQKKTTSPIAPSIAPPVMHIDADAEFETRRLLSELHQAWKDFDPLQCALTKINRQLEILESNPPRDVYLTTAERRLINWHFANLEFANATELKNLSLRHWDQDDAFELTGAHCAIRGGFGGLVEALTSTYSTLALSSAAVNVTDRPALKVDSSSLLTSGGGACGQIELKTSVKSIKMLENGVAVEGLNAAFSQDEVISYKATVVLCTFPLGVLKESVRQQREKQIEVSPSKQQSSALLNTFAPFFHPPLPDWKLDAVERLGFGVLNKVVLFFDRFFWDKSQRSFGCVQESEEKRGELFLFWSITDRPCLIGLVAGRAALDLPPPSKATSSSGHANEPIVVRAMTILRKIFRRDAGSAIPDPIDAYVTRWQDDLHTRGSYSYVAVGATGRDYDYLAEPLGAVSSDLSDHVVPDSVPGAPAHSTLGCAQPPRVFFAGEHTCRHYPASVHGALLSGLREAARIANAFFPGETPVTRSGFHLNPPQTMSNE